MITKDLLVLLIESDLSSPVYVRIIDENGDEKFLRVTGLCGYSDSYRPTNMITRTTLELELPSWRT